MHHQCNQHVRNKEYSEIILRSEHQSWYASEKVPLNLYNLRTTFYKDTWLRYNRMKRLFYWRKLVLVQSVCVNLYLHRGLEHLCPRLLVEGPTGQCPCSRWSLHGRMSQSMVCVCSLEKKDKRVESSDFLQLIVICCKLSTLV